MVKVMAVGRPDCPWPVALRHGESDGLRLHLDPGARAPVAVWFHRGAPDLTTGRLEEISAHLGRLLADMDRGDVLPGAFDAAVFRPLFVPGRLQERPRVRRPHLASLELYVVDVEGPDAYGELCERVAIETRRLPVPGGGRLTAFHVRVPVVAEPCSQILKMEDALLRHELLHALAAQVLGFGGHDGGRGLDPLCVSAEVPGTVPERPPAPKRVADGRTELEREVGGELRRRVARAVSALTDPHAKLRVVQRIAAAFVEYWERNPGPMRASAWRRILGAGGESVEAWCASQAAPSDRREEARRASLALAAAEACPGGWARLAGPCDALAEVVEESGEAVLVLRAIESSPGYVDTEGWVALSGAGSDFADFVRRVARDEARTLRDAWGRWCCENRGLLGGQCEPVNVVTVGLTPEEVAAWESASAYVSWLHITWHHLLDAQRASAVLPDLDSGPTLLVAGGICALDHIMVAQLTGLAASAAVERLYLRAVEVDGVVPRIDGRRMYADLAEVRLSVPAFEPWLRWSGADVHAMDPRFRVEPWVPGPFSPSSPALLLAGASRLHRERLEVATAGATA